MSGQTPLFRRDGRGWWCGGYVVVGGTKVSLGSILMDAGLTDREIAAIAKKVERAAPPTGEPEEGRPQPERTMKP